jgi:hypothetical protein
LLLLRISAKDAPKSRRAMNTKSICEGGMSGTKNQIVTNNSFTDFLLYTTPNGKVKVEIFLKDENGTIGVRLDFLPFSRMM